MGIEIFPIGSGMKEVETGGSSLERLMEAARQQALIDEWAVQGDAVRLHVGTYELELQRRAADLFVRGLLRNHEHAMTRSRS